MTKQMMIKNEERIDTLKYPATGLGVVHGLVYPKNGKTYPSRSLHFQAMAKVGLLCKAFCVLSMN